MIIFKKSFFVLKEATLLKAIFFSLVFILLLLSFYALHNGNFFLFHEDEALYYKSAKLFYETNSIKAAGCITEGVSKILQTSWYGPFYHIFYGGIAKIFGFNNYYFVIIHLLLILFSIYILSLLNISIEKRIVVFVAFLSAPGILSYIFTLFPESLHLFFSVVLMFLLTKIYQKPEDRKYIIVFVILVLFFTLFRVTTIFWLIGILPFAKNKKEFALYTVVLMGGVVFALLYMRFFTAPAFAEGIKKFDYLFQFQIFDFGKYIMGSLLKNIYGVFSQSSIPLFYLFVLFSITLVQLFKEWDKILLSATLIAILSFFTLLSFYVSASFYFEKQTAFLFPLLIVANIISSSQKNKILIIVFISILPFSLVQTYENIHARKIMYAEYVKNEKMVSQFSELANIVNPDKESIIQWLYGEYNFPNNLTEAILPYSNKKGYPIRYTTNICLPTASDSIKFQRFGKYKIDYILSKNKLEFNDIELIKKTDYYYFYKIVR